MHLYSALVAFALVCSVQSRVAGKTTAAPVPTTPLATTQPPVVTAARTTQPPTTKAPTTVARTTRPPTTKPPTTTVKLTIPPILTTDRDCPCTLSNLWLDVAVSIDTSTGMGTNGFIQVLANLDTVFAQSNISQPVGQNSRVGISTYDKTATTRYPITYFTSTDQFEGEIFNMVDSVPIKVDQSIIKTGLQSASNILSSNKRKNVKQAIIVYASDYQADGENDPTEVADALKSSGIYIIVVSFNQGGQGNVLRGLKNLASPGMFIQSTDPDAVGAVQAALCQVNCFCPNTWRQYGDNFATPTHNFGECVKFGEIASSWTPAKYACQALAPGAFLATDFTQNKTNYLRAMAIADNTFSRPHEFHVGLSYDQFDQKWQWEQGQGKPTVYADRNTKWASGYPDANPSVNKCGLLSPVDTSESDLALKNINCNTVSKRYACQVITCDTDNYCA